MSQQPAPPADQPVMSSMKVMNRRASIATADAHSFHPTIPLQTSPSNHQQQPAQETDGKIDYNAKLKQTGEALNRYGTRVSNTSTELLNSTLSYFNLNNNSKEFVIRHEDQIIQEAPERLKLNGQIVNTTPCSLCNQRVPPPTPTPPPRAPLAPGIPNSTNPQQVDANQAIKNINQSKISLTTSNNIVGHQRCHYCASLVCKNCISSTREIVLGFAVPICNLCTSTNVRKLKSPQPIWGQTQ